MTPEERSKLLLAEANEVLKEIHLFDHCKQIGNIVPTGSYFLNLMMYPDIDLYLPPTTAENLLKLGSTLAQYECIQKIRFEKGTQGELKGGLYLSPNVQWGNWGRQWKIDIWAIPTSLIDKKQAYLSELKQKMTTEQRMRILETKHQLLTPEGRTPMFSGYFIYKAIIEHNMKELPEIVKFLQLNGIVIDNTQK